MDYIFIKEGYSLWAGLFGPFWLFMKAMWVEAGVMMGGLIFILTIFGLLGFHGSALFGALMFSNLVFGLFARDLVRRHYERKGYQLTDVVNGKSLDECECRYFRRLKNEP